MIKTRSLGQIVLKLYSPSRGHSFASIFMKLNLNVCLDNISVKLDQGSKSRSPGQSLVKSCLHSLGHIFGSVFFKVVQNVCLDDISVKFNHRWDGVKTLVTRSNLSLQAVYRLGATVLMQSSSNLLRMSVLIISGSSLIMESKSRSLGQI